MCRTTQILLALSFAIATVHGYGTHSGLCTVVADPAATATSGGMGGRSNALNANSAFGISINPGHVTASMSHTVTLARTSGTGGFRGLLLYIEDATNTRIGTWTPTSKIQTMPPSVAPCTGRLSTITHTSATPNTFASSQDFTWTAPATVNGPVLIHAIAYDGVFNAPTPLSVSTTASPTISPSTNAPSATPSTAAPSRTPSTSAPITGTMPPTTAAPTGSPITSAPTTTAQPTASPITYPTGAAESACAMTLVNLGTFGMKAAAAANQTHAAVRLRGPSTSWFGLGFGTLMPNSPSLIYTTALDLYNIGAQKSLASVVGGKVTTNPFTVVSDVTVSGTVTVCAVFSTLTPTTGIDFSGANANVIFAQGAAATLTAQGHGTNRNSETMTVSYVGPQIHPLSGSSKAGIQFAVVCTSVWLLWVM